MTLLRIAITCLALLFAITGQAENAYMVTHVYDGDTVELKNTEGRFKLRLAGIDAPERNQAYGQKSRRALAKLCKSDKVVVTAQILGTDKYNRSLGNLQCDHVDAGLHLVEQGLAWHYAKHSNNVSTQNAELVARQKKRGLWKDKKPMPPWVWRQTH